MFFRIQVFEVLVWVQGVGLKVAVMTVLQLLLTLQFTEHVYIF